MNHIHIKTFEVKAVILAPTEKSFRDLRNSFR